MAKYQITTFALSSILLAATLHIYFKSLDNVVQLSSLVFGGFRNYLSILLWLSIILFATSAITNLLARADIEHHISTMHPYREEEELTIITIKRILTYSSIGMILASLVILLLALLRASVMF